MWNNMARLDYSSKEEITAFQNKELQKQITYIYNNSTYYKALFDAKGIKPTDIKSIADLLLIPTTTKAALDKHNNKMVCVGKERIIEYVTTSGTLGDPIIIALTKNDLDRLAYNEKRSLEIAGITKQDTVHLTTTLDKMFMAGMAYYLGAVSLGASVIRSGIGSPGPQWKSIDRFSPTTTIIVPSFLYKLSKFRLSEGINPNNSSVKKAICIGEPIRNSDFTPNRLHQKISANWDIQLYSTYASTEMMTAFTECDAQNGGHLLPELVIIEILDKNGHPVEEGQLGEITITPLGVEGTPVLRYRTGDLARTHGNNCSCGRNTLRLGAIEGRKKQMIKLKGTTIFPQSIEEVLQLFDTVEHYVIEISTSPLGTDNIKIYISDTLNDEFEKTLQKHLVDAIRVTPEIKRISNANLIGMLHPEGGRKPKKIIDIRELTIDE